MKTVETNNLIFEDFTNISYLNELIFYVDEHEQEVLDTFRMLELSSKWKVEIIPFEDFKNLMSKFYGKYEGYMAGHASSYNKLIRVLNVEDQIKYTIHKETTIEKLEKQIMHEFVHACYSDLVGKENTIHWFNEGLACYISHQDRKFVDISNIDFNIFLNDFNKLSGKGYTPAYLIVKYIFENYSSDEVYRLISEPNYLIKKTSIILNEAIEWIKTQVNSKTKK